VAQEPAPAPVTTALGTSGQGKVVLAARHVTAERRILVSPAGTPGRARVISRTIGSTAASTPDRSGPPAQTAPRQRVVIPAVRRAGGSAPALA